jgi:fructokinase
VKGILCIGEALIDMICTDKGATLSHGEHFLKKTGGAPTNVAAAIAALGGQVDLIAKVGYDPFGDQLVAAMKAFGVSTDYMYRDHHHFTTLAFVSLMENGERDFVFSRGADGQLTIDEVRAVDLDPYSIVHFGSATAFLPGPLCAAYDDLLDRSLAAGKWISFDPNYRHLLFKDNQAHFIASSWKYLTACHFFKVSDEEAMLLTDTHSLVEAVNHLMSKTTCPFAITLGAEGTLFRYGSSHTIIPSISIKATDTTGAGDAFVGAVLYLISQETLDPNHHLPLPKWNHIISMANKAGARTCEYMGAMEAFKHLNHSIFSET